MDYGDPHGARATVSPMETALAVEVERLAAGGGEPRDAVADARMRREADVLRRTLDAERRRAVAACLDADILSVALTDLLAAVGAGDRAAVRGAVADAVELLGAIAPVGVASAA
ncbi:hypothetical protein DVS28_b0229 (plasmid) [Euzebya pacifica]|uniref:Uncharacterized protein n=1 Tax=Euzebya pacifica TaxID=1608957 RepID=A0A346Y6A2_9ACTN|nr:hypothetical protein DVS28_b0229 [Euzebya pacifica]